MNRAAQMALILASLATACTVAAEGLRLEFQKLIGDVRGKGLENLSVTVADDGTTYLLMAVGRVAVFGPDGAYARSLDIELPWPHHDLYLSAWGKQVLLGDYRKDYPWLFSERRVGDAPGRFSQPAMATADRDGTLYVADTGNRRVQVFAGGDTSTPRRMIGLDAKPGRIAVRDGKLALLLDDQSLRLLDATADPPKDLGRMGIGPAAVAVAIAPDNAVLVAFNGGPDRHFLKRYRMDPATDKLAEVATLAPSYLAQWPDLYPVAAPMTSAPDGTIWFATSHVFGSVLALDPATDTITEKVRALANPRCVGFGADGRVYVGGGAKSASGGRRVQVVAMTSLALPATEFPAGKDLYRDDGVPVWSLLPDQDGGVFVRVVEEGYRKGWPAFTLKKVFADGTVKPLVDFGELYAKRTTFHPAAAAYSLQFDAEGNLVLAALPLVAVCKLAPDGQVLWEAGLEPRGGADRIEFGEPRATAIDRRGRIWVADSRKHQVFCLSAQGKGLLVYGTRTGVDDLGGKGFRGPAAVATATINGTDFLYVGDAGNQRIVKFRIVDEPTP